MDFTNEENNYGYISDGAVRIMELIDTCFSFKNGNCTHLSNKKDYGHNINKIEKAVAAGLRKMGADGLVHDFNLWSDFYASYIKHRLLDSENA